MLSSAQLRRISSITGVLLCLYAAMSVWLQNRRFAGVDFYQYWVVPQILVGEFGQNVYAGSADLTLHHHEHNLASPRYSTAAGIRLNNLRLSGSPFLYTMLSVFSGVNYDESLERFRFVALISFVVALSILCFLSGYCSVSTLLTIACALLWFEPLRSDLRVGNVNQLQLLSLALILTLILKFTASAYQLLAGIILGALLLFKPNLLLILPALVVVWIGFKDYSKLMYVAGGVLLGIVFAVIVSALYFNSIQCWSEWFGVVMNLSQQGEELYPVSSGNYSLSTFLQLVFGFRPFKGYGILFVLPFFTSVYVGAVRRREASHADKARYEYLSVGTAILISMLSAPLVWSHYYLLLTPLIIIALTQANLALSVLMVLLWLILNISAELGVSVTDINYLFLFIFGSLILCIHSVIKILKV